MKKALLAIGGLLLALLIFTFRTINTSKDNSVSVSGIVEDVSEQGYKDASFKFVGNKELYYINRGLENNFNLQELKKLEGQKVTIMYAKNWSPLFLIYHPSWHITEMRQGEKILYSECH